MSKKVKRLFEGFKPENYNLAIDIDASKTKFSGSVVITGQKVGRPSQRITLHQKDLKITSTKITRFDKTGEQEIEISRTNLQKTYDEVRLHSKSNLYPSKYKIELEFSGDITDVMNGLYPCRFKHDGKDKILLATQFESHHAREVFPCIDEPEAKATFDLTITAPSNETILSNTPVKAQKKSGKKQIVTFETTPIMSVYLLAFAAGEIHNIEGKTKDGVEVKSWATVAQPKSFLKYANKEAIDILEFYIDYFKTPFPLSKIDQIALPDFEAGAMENWGLITYRESALLADPVNRSISSEQHISMVVSHELSHQWFGNLVTMKWWNDLWLNESFASMVEHIALDMLHPDWQQWESFTSYDVIAASNRDNYLDVQPVGTDVNHPDEISTLFDPAIVYAKGARLMKMLYDYMGEENFRAGLKSYFSKHAYKNTTRDDLWAELSAASKRDIGDLMTPWIKQSGMPVLNVSRNKTQLILEQNRFLLEEAKDDSLWPIPLLPDKKLEIDVLDKKMVELTCKESVEPVFNQNGSGHYIVNYADSETKANIKQKIIKREISASGRINTLNDMLLLAQKGDYPLTSVIDIVDECSQEPRDAVWSLFARAIGYGTLLTEGDETAEGQLKKLRIELAKHWFALLGWDDRHKDDPNTKLLRQTALALSVAGEDKDALKIALKKFAAAKSVEEIPAEQRAIIAGTEVKFGKAGTVRIEKLMREYVGSSNPDVQQSITAALCSTKQPEIAKKLIKWGLDKGGVVRPQDVFRWYAHMVRNRHTRDIAWEWLIANWDVRQEELGGAKTMPYYVRFSAGTITKKVWEDKFRKFFEPKIDEPGLGRDIKVAYKEIAARITWRNREEPTLKKYLDKYS